MSGLRAQACAALVIAATVVLTAGCASSATVPPPSSAPPPSGAEPERAGGGAGAGVGRVVVGEASYYADSLAGHATASGEPYDPHKLTAAHRTLPLGTLVAVEREDGRRVEVRINDRGPFGREGRILDLSKRAAEELGMLRAGVAKIRMTILKLGPARAKKKRRHRHR
jgi:rare lipoprotein A